MSGTPVLGPLVDGLAGTTPLRLRGVLNATANSILSAMERGATYDAALAEAQDVGLAERDPSADVDGYDSLAKTMILAALVFEEQLKPADVVRQGIVGIGREQVEGAAEDGKRIRLVSSLERAHGALAARVEPLALPDDDPLARLDGVTNAVVCEAEPVGEVAISGPGAGLELAGQGVFGDLVAVGRQHRSRA
jgi:homoserine dehydrogenase